MVCGIEVFTKPKSPIGTRSMKMRASERKA